MGFDLSSELSAVKEQSFEPLPAGKYTLQCESAELVDTSGGSGQAIKCVFNVIGQEYNGRKVFNYFNISNPSEKAQQIGLGQLKSFIVCAGGTPEVEGKNLPNSLVGMAATATLKIRKSDEYGDSNTISGFSKSADAIMAKAKTSASSSIPF